MTAEVAVLNKFGVALAADSAVSIDHYHHRTIHRKIYNSANKLFTLSKFRPVGIMIYNTIALGGIPYETLIKEYRRQLHQRKFDTVEEYANDFFGWLAGNHLFSPTHIDDIVNTNMMRAYRDLVQGVKSKSDFVTDLDREIARLTALDDVPGFDDAFMTTAAATYQGAIDSAASTFVKTSWMQGNKVKLRQFAQLLLRKKSVLEGYTGIAIAGFGEQEALPRLREYLVDIVVGDKVRFWLRKTYQIDEKTPSVVVPLADAGAIRTLTEGISLDFQKVIYENLEVIFRNMPAKVLGPVQTLSAAQRQSYVTAAQTVLAGDLQAFWTDLSKHLHENYIDPMKQALAALPIGELSTLAETFLGISQIQKRVAAEQETVGGPVDVAIISKGDGFIWTKRKFYFEEKLNPAFAQKYLDQQ